MFVKRIVVVFKKNIHLPVQETPPFERLKNNSKQLYNFFEQAESCHQQSWQMLLQILKNFSLPVHIHVRGDGDMPALDKSDLVISFGGDGTFLYASHFITNSLLLGINSSPRTSVGYFCRYALPTHERQIEQTVMAALQGAAECREITRLQVRINGVALPIAILNDILICEKIPVITSRYVLQFCEQEQDQKSSGVWISTASGSTAAFQSAGGTPFSPNAKKKQFAFVVRELYQPKEERIERGMVQEGDSFSLVSGMKSGQIFIDGNPEAHLFTVGDKLEVGFHPHILRSL